jgi:hypothetical protein
MHLGVQERGTRKTRKKQQRGERRVADGTEMKNKQKQEGECKKKEKGCWGENGDTEEEEVWEKNSREDGKTRRD